MKNLIAGAGICLLVLNSAQAGGLAEPILEAEVIEEQSSSSGGSIVPLVLLAVVVALIATNSGGDSAPVALSDGRLKENVVRVGETTSGLPLYHFSYIGSADVFEGVMAQDVLNHTPDAVVVMSAGYYGVNYDLLGLEMRRVR